MSKQIKTRIQQKHDIEANWLKAGLNETTPFIPYAGELIVYEAETQATFDAAYATLSDKQKIALGRTTPIGEQRFKIGNGSTNVHDLPFVSNPHEHEISTTTATVVAEINPGSGSFTPTTKYLHKTTGNAAPNAHTHSVTVSDTTEGPNEDGVSVVTGVGANGTATVLTGVKASGTDTFIKEINAGSGSLTGNTTATNGIQYVESISATTGTLNSYDAATDGTEKVANGTRIPYVASVTHTAASVKTTADAAPSGHTHSVTVSGTTGNNSGTAVKAVTGYGSFSGGSGSLVGNATTGGIQYVESITPCSGDLVGNTTTGGITYVESIAAGSGSLVGNTTNTGIKYVEAQGTFSAGTTPPKSATPTHTSTNTGSAGGGTASQATGAATPTFTGSEVTSGAASATTTSPAGANTTTTSDTGSAGGGTTGATTGSTTPTFTGSEVTSGGASTTTTSSVNGSESSTTGAATPTFTGSAVTSGGSSAANTGNATVLTSASVSSGVLTITSSTHNHTMAHTHSVTAAGTVSEHTHSYNAPKAHTHTLSHTHKVTAAGTVGAHTHTYTAPAAHTHTYYGPVDHTHTLSHTHKVTAAGTVSEHTHTYTKPAAHTHTYDKTTGIEFVAGTAPSLGAATTKYLHHTHTAPTATTKYLHHTHNPSSATSKYLHHTHTAASLGTASTANAAPHTHTHTFSDDAVTAATTSTAVKAVTAVNGGGITPTTYYLNHTDPAHTATTKYLHHTHTGASTKTTGSAVTGVASNGTASVLTGVKATGTISVAPDAHTHDFSATATTGNNSGSPVTVIKDLTVNTTAATGDITYVESASHTHTGASVKNTATVVKTVNIE